MKVIKTAAMVVGAVALVATGVGAIGGVAALGAIGLGSVSMATLSAVGTIAGLVGTAANAISPPKAAKGTVGGAQTDFKLDPNAGLSYLIGRTYSGGNIVHRETWGQDNQYQGFVVSYSAGGTLQAVENYQIDRIITALDANGAAIGTYNGWLWNSWQLGRTPNPDLVSPVAGFPGFAPGFRLSGHTTGVLVAKFDVKNGKKFTGAFPRTGGVFIGERVYDPRQDSTYPGGNGPCRALDEATYVGGAAAENPWCHAATWALGRYQNGKRVMGVGQRYRSIDWPAFVDAMNVADANGWKVGGVISSIDDKWDVLRQMAQAGGGTCLRLGSKLTCYVNAPKVALATVRDSDLVGKADLSAAQTYRDTLNGMVPKYRSEAHGWEIIPGPTVRVGPYVVADGEEKTREWPLPLVQQGQQAGQLVAYELVNRREFGPINIPLFIRFMGYKPGDALNLAINDLGLVDQLAVVRQRKIDASSGNVMLALVTETAAKHPYALGQTPIAPRIPDLSVPDESYVAAPSAADWQSVGGELEKDGQKTPVIILTGTVRNPNAEAFFVETRVVGSPNWSTVGTFPAQTVRVDITSIAPATSYYVGVSIVRRGVTGERLQLDPVGVGIITAGDALYGDGDSIHGWKPQDKDATNGAPAGTVVGGIRNPDGSYSGGIPAEDIPDQFTDLRELIADLDPDGGSGAAAAAKEAQQAAEVAAANSATARDQSQAARDAALAARTQAGDSAASALASAGNASTKATEAGNFRTEASNSATNAAGSASTASTAAGTATSARDTATAAAGAAGTYRNEASASAANALGSETRASTSAGTATTARDAAAASASSAATYRDEASTSAQGAAGSASTANTAAGVATTARDVAGGSAQAAAGSASTASTKADAASTSAQAAEASKVAATTAKGQAETARDAAATSKSDAAGSANSASLSAGAAATARDDAGRSAGAASTSAQSAAASKTTAEDKASAAAGSATVASTKAGEASTSAGQASTSASNASGSANTASSQAVLSSNSATASQKAAAASLPSTFDQQGTFWGPELGPGSRDEMEYLYDSAIGAAVARNKAAGEYGAIRRLASFPNAPGRIFRVRVRAASDGNNGSFLIRLAAYNSQGDASAWYATMDATKYTAPGGQYTWHEQTFPEINNGQGFVRPIVYPNYPNINGKIHLAVIEMVDVTSEQMAAASASASNTSAGTASTKASEAGQSAAAAQGYANTANTARGGAESARSDAATSESNARGSASSAAAQAALSASAVGQAMGAGLTGGRSAGAAPSQWTVNRYNDFDAGQSVIDPTHPTSLVVNGNLRITNAQAHWHPIKATPVVFGRRYEVSLTFRRVVDGPYQQGHNLYLTYFDKDGALLYGNTEYQGAIFGFANVADGPQKIVNIVAPAANVAFIRPMYRSPEGGSTDLIDLGVTDVTAREAAAGSASAANTSSATAAAKATDAGNYASAANDARIAAQAANGSAETQASTAINSAAVATAAAAASSSSATLAASVGLGAMNLNADFSTWYDTQTLPERWGYWNQIVQPVRVSGAVGRYAMEWNAGGKEDFGASVRWEASPGLSGLSPGQYYMLTAEVTLVAGQFGNSGVHVNFYGPDGNLAAGATGYYIDFEYDKDASGNPPSLGIAGRRYRYSKLIKDTSTNGANVWLYAMPRWAGLPSPRRDQILDYHYIGIRRATSEEIASGVALPAISAKVTEQAGAIALIDGRSQAYWEVSTDAGGAGASIEARSMRNPNGSTSSNVGIVAEEFSVSSTANGVRKRVLRVQGSEAVIDGTLSATAGVFLQGGAKWAYQLRQQSFAVSDGQQVTFGVDLGAPPSVDFQTSGLTALATGETYRLYADQVTSTGFIARLRIVSAGASTSQSQENSTAPGSGPTRQVNFDGKPTSSSGTYQIAASGSFTGRAALDQDMGQNAYSVSGTMIIGIWRRVGGVWGKFKTVQIDIYKRAPVASAGNQNVPWDLKDTLALGSGVTDIGYTVEQSTGAGYTTPYLAAFWQNSTSTSDRTATPNGEKAQSVVRP